MATKKAAQGLTFSPTPHCCGVELGHDWPGIECAVCHTVYNADDVVEALMVYRNGGDPSKMKARVRA